MIGIYLATKSLFNRRIALLATLITGFTIWPIMLGRLATRPALLPLILSFSLWLGFEAWRSRAPWRWFLSGLLLGAAFYTYTPIRAIVFTLPIWAVAIVMHRRGRHLWPGTLLFLAAFTLIVYPLARYSLIHWQEVFDRTIGISVIDLTQSPRQIVATSGFIYCIVS